MGIVLLAVAFAVGGVVLGGDGTAELQPDSPEAVVQEYVQAFIDRDEELAMSLVAESRCGDPDSVRRIEEGIRVTLLDVSERRADAEVRLLVTTSGGDLPFDRYEWSEELVFDMVRLGDGTWLIDDVPWRFSLCEEVPNS